MVALAVVIVLLVVGSLIFHVASPWYFTPIASNWSTIDFTVDVTFWVCGIVFVAVNLFTAYCVWRFRARKDKAGQAHYEPESKKLEIALTVFTAIGVAAMLTPGLFVWGKFVTVPGEAKDFEAVGKQWHWSYRLPGKDNKLGHSEVRFMTVDNPLGVDPDDPAGKDDIIIADPTFHLLLNQPVQVLLRSTDVLHDFAVPQFRVKMDLVPGLVTYQWFTPTQVGTYEMLCEELCGVGHFAMRGRMVVDEPGRLRQVARVAADVRGHAGAAGRQRDGRGRELRGLLGMSRSARRGQPAAQRAEALGTQRLVHPPPAARFSARCARRRRQGDTFGAQMAAMSQTVADPATRENVLAHIKTLPDTRPRRRSRATSSTAAGCSRPVSCATATRAKGAGAPTRRSSRA